MYDDDESAREYVNSRKVVICRSLLQNRFVEIDDLYWSNFHPNEPPLNYETFCIIFSINHNLNEIITKFVMKFF